MTIKVPEFGDGSAYASVISWFVENNQKVVKGQKLVELETDKVLLTLETPADGIVKEIFKLDGAYVCTGDELARIEEE